MSVVKSNFRLHPRMIEINRSNFGTIQQGLIDREKNNIVLLL